MESSCFVSEILKVSFSKSTSTSTRQNTSLAEKKCVAEYLRGSRPSFLVLCTHVYVGISDYSSRVV